MNSFYILLIVGFLSGIVFSSFFEWTLHRFFMHRITLKWRYPFQAHAVVHHGIFRADHTYHLINENDKKTIPMAWWNGPVIVITCQIPFLITAIILEKWALICGSAIACSLYFATYEYLHWCMHLPKQRRLEKGWWFQKLNGHHLLHHRYMHKNFNVVLPLADMLLGTLLLRSKIIFAQARGPSVPDVQPRS